MFVGHLVKGHLKAKLTGKKTVGWGERESSLIKGVYRFEQSTRFSRIFLNLFSSPLFWVWLVLLRVMPGIHDSSPCYSLLRHRMPSYSSVLPIYLIRGLVIPVDVCVKAVELAFFFFPVTLKISVPFKVFVLWGLWNPSIHLLFVLLLRKFHPS